LLVLIISGTSKSSSYTWKYCCFSSYRMLTVLCVF